MHANNELMKYSPLLVISVLHATKMSEERTVINSVNNNTYTTF